jgi:hypothetical protein
MPSTTVRITQSSRLLLRRLAKRLGKPMQAVLDEAVEEYRRKVFLEAVNLGYAKLRANPKAWAEEVTQRHQWDATLMDGLNRNESFAKKRKSKGNRSRKR